MDDQQMWCDAAQAEYRSLPHWSQAKDKLARRMWHNGCVAQLEALGEMPITSGTAPNWAEDRRQPPASGVIPGNPADRQPPEN